MYFGGIAVFVIEMDECRCQNRCQFWWQWLILMPFVSFGMFCHVLLSVKLMCIFQIWQLLRQCDGRWQTGQPWLMGHSRTGRLWSPPSALVPADGACVCKFYSIFHNNWIIVCTHCHGHTRAQSNCFWSVLFLQENQIPFKHCLEFRLKLTSMLFTNKRITKT